VESCYESGRVWDPAKCMCRCPLSTLQECSSKFVFDFTNSCKCIPEESNEIGLRSERSQEISQEENGGENGGRHRGRSSSPVLLSLGDGTNLILTWELLAIAGLAAILVLALVLAAVLIRSVRRLKDRLRR